MPELQSITANNEQSVVDILERMLARAKRGEIVGVAVLGELKGGLVTHVYSTNNPFKLIGATESLKLRMLDDMPCNEVWEEGEDPEKGGP